ncbi:MAG: cytidylyltransferase domain-containing protein [Syntrophales bacterium]|jgi:spore coat polysaccharide biosynthesis protein SpsF
MAAGQFGENDMSIGAIIQARTGSKRLPQKILLELPHNSGVTVLENIIARAQKVKVIDKIIVATSTDPEDDIVEVLCNRSQAICFRGDLENVLARFYHAASTHGLTTVIRLTADNPCYDYQVIGCALQAHMEDNNDYTITENYPLGTNVEVISFSALETCFQKASCQYEREHVTPYIYKTEPNEFKTRTVFSLVDNADLRLTLDTKDDYLFQCAIYDNLYSSSSCFGIDEIINLLERKSWLKEINHETYQKKKFNNIEEEISEAMRILELNELTNVRKYLDSLFRNRD